MFAAASVTDTSVRDALIGSVHAYASANSSNTGNFPLAVVYDASTSQEMMGSGDVGGLNRFVHKVPNSSLVLTALYLL